jgi:hypothetical protein
MPWLASDSGMNRIAVFVEGQTEQLFVAKLFREIAGRRNLQVETWKGAGRHDRRRFQLLWRDPEHPDVQYYVLIVDSSNAENVASDMLSQYRSLADKGYSRILGLRDVYPVSGASAPAKLERVLGDYMARLLPTPSIPVDVLLAVMEIEAWFVAEHTHFGKLDPTLTCERIRKEVGFDPSTDNVEKIRHPSATLDQIYQLVGRRYTERKASARNTVNKLDGTLLCLDVPKRAPRLSRLLKHIDVFMDRSRR